MDEKFAEYLRIAARNNISDGRIAARPYQHALNGTALQLLEFSLRKTIGRQFMQVYLKTRDLKHIKSTPIANILHAIHLLSAYIIKERGKYPKHEIDLYMKKAATDFGLSGKKHAVNAVTAMEAMLNHILEHSARPFGHISHDINRYIMDKITEHGSFELTDDQLSVIRSGFMDPITQSQIVTLRRGRQALMDWKILYTHKMFQSGSVVVITDNYDSTFEKLYPLTKTLSVGNSEYDSVKIMNEKEFGIYVERKPIDGIPLIIWDINRLPKKPLGNATTVAFLSASKIRNFKNVKKAFPNIREKDIMPSMAQNRKV